MSTEYDPLTKEYTESKGLIFRVYSEVPNHLAMLGALDGLKVIDLACGDGFYTRRIRRGGAKLVYGIDISERMIELALKKEEQIPLGITYRVCGATDLSELSPQSFDLASTAFLFNCARDQEELFRMFSEIAGRLRPGGRLCATVGDLGHRPGVDYRPYGMRTQIPSDLAEGEPYDITFLLDDGEFTITDFNHSLSTSQRIGEEVGLRFQSWAPCTVTTEGIDKYGQSFWQSWIDSPCIWRFEAIKA